MNWNTFIHKIHREFFQPFWQITQRVSPYDLVVSILICFSISAGLCDGCPRTTLLIFSILDDAGCDVGITASCGTDVGDVCVAELEEPVDKPGTTVGT